MTCKSLDMLQAQCLRYSLDPETRLIDRHLISRYCTRVSTMILVCIVTLRTRRARLHWLMKKLFPRLSVLHSNPALFFQHVTVWSWIRQREQPGHQTFDLTAFCVFDYFCVEVKASVCVFVQWLFYIKETHLRGKRTGRSWPFDPNLGWREKESMCQCIYSTVRRHHWNQSLKSF